MTSPTPPSRPACGTHTPPHPYNTPLHIAALFQILILSTLACSFPLLARRYPKLPIPQNFLELSRHFGTGVLLATAFVHLLPTAYVSLTDPCLPRFWNEIYPAMAGLVSMGAVLVVVGVEMGFAGQGARHTHSHGLGLGRELERDRERPANNARWKGYEQVRRGEDEQDEAVPLQDRMSVGEVSNAVDKPLPAIPPYEDDSDLDLDELDFAGDDRRALNGRAHKQQPSSSHAHRPTYFAHDDTLPPPPSPHLHIPPAPNEQRMVLQLLLLEAGILFHSVFIGMALSVSTGPAFIVLLVAISFHQTFEGLALGSRIAAIPSFTPSSPKPWLMSLLYGITTPLGQAFGLAAHTLYDPASEAGLLTVGLVNAVSSGLLLYAGLVQLLAEDFLSERSYSELKGRRRLEACGAVVCGSALMAFVGAFA